MDIRGQLSERQQQTLMIVGIMVVALGLVYLLFLSGDGSAQTPAAVPASDPAAPVDEGLTEDVEGSKDKVTKPKQGPVETFEVFAARDPFMPLVPQGSKGSGSGSGSGAEPQAGSSGSSAGNEPSSGKTVNGHRVKLVDVFTKGGQTKVQVQVDSTVYTVDEGEVFADNFQVLSISGQCASMLFGDDQFTLCEGEEILK